MGLYNRSIVFFEIGLNIRNGFERLSLRNMYIWCKRFHRQPPSHRSGPHGLFGKAVYPAASDRQVQVVVERTMIMAWPGEENLNLDFFSCFWSQRKPQEVRRELPISFHGPPRLNVSFISPGACLGRFRREIMPSRRTHEARCGGAPAVQTETFHW